jgi:3-isopropylmalate dehydrogenase
MALLLDHLGCGDDAQRIEAAVDADIAERGATRRPTSVVGDDIASRV